MRAVRLPEHAAERPVAVSSVIAAPETSQPSASPIPGPQIVSVSSPAVVHDGESATWRVRTTRDVVSVSAHVSFYTFELQEEAPGRFTVSFTIPPGVPPFFHGAYSMDIRAQGRDGVTVDRTVPVIFE